MPSTTTHFRTNAMTKKRLQPADRKQQILDAALRVAARPGGWGRLTREAVAKEAACAEGLPSVYFGTMVNFKRAIMRAAITGRNLPIIAQGIASGDRCALKAPPQLRAEAMTSLGG